MAERQYGVLRRRRQELRRASANQRRTRMARAIMDSAGHRTAWQPIPPRRSRRFMTPSGIFDNLPRVLWNTVKNSAYVLIRQARSHAPCPMRRRAGDDPTRWPILPPLSPPCAMLSPHISCSPCFFLTFRSPSCPSRESMCYTNRRSGLGMNNKGQPLDTHSTRWYCSGIHVWASF